MHSTHTLQRLNAGEAWRLGRLGGELVVVEGRVWLTRDGDPGDHVIEPGERLRLGIGENAVIEAAETRRPVTLRWYPRRRSFVGALAAEPLRGLAFLTGLAATGFAALAHREATSANRAQGCISNGDSTAPCSALK